MAQQLSSEWGWKFSIKEPIVGLHQADQDEHVTLSDEKGGVYVVDPRGALLLDLGFPAMVRSARIVARGQRLLVLDQEGGLHAFHFKGRRLWKVFTDVMATCMDAWIDGQGIAVGCRNGLVLFYNNRGQKLRAVYLQHPVSFLKFSYKKHSLLAASADGRISFINPKLNFEWMLNMRTVCGGIDVDHNASLIVLTAFVEGAYAFNSLGEAIGAFEINDSIQSCALCQNGQRILVTNDAGRLHVLRRDGSLEYFLDVNTKIPRMDLNYMGDCVVLQTGAQELKCLRFRDGSQGRASFLHVPATPSELPKGSNSKNTKEPNSHKGVLWQVPIPRGGEGQIRLTAHGAFCVCLSENHELVVWNHEGTLLWKKALDPIVSAQDVHRLVVARAANSLLIIAKDWVDYYTCDQGHTKRLEIEAQTVSVHDSGLNFSISTPDFKLCFFDKEGECVWSKPLDFPIWDQQISPQGNAVFVACGDQKLRAYREQGKLVWEKALQSTERKLVLGDETPSYNHKVISLASDGYRFRSKIVKKNTHFVLDRYGITLGNKDGEIFRMNNKGKRVWEHKVMEPILFMKNLRKNSLIKAQSGKDYIFDRKGDLIQVREPTEGLRQYAADNADQILVLESQDETLTCENLTKKEILWYHEAGNKITQFDIEVTGSKVAYVSESKVCCLPLAASEVPVSETVAFLEF